MEQRHEVIFLPPAQTELEEITRVHMALAGPRSARKITDAVFDALEQLARFPLSGPMVQDEQLSAAGYRYILVEKYLVFYRVMGDTVFVYHIAHGATDYPSSLRLSLL